VAEVGRWKMPALQEGFWFGSVGLVAAVVHLLIFEGLRHVIRPELANLGGFLVAFSVSFVGHRRLSFKGTQTPVHQSLIRFWVTAIAGFLVNELSFMFLLHSLAWAVWPALVVSLVLAAGQTFVLSRWWAFRR
jgi:putative flippase GtrA